MEWLTFALDKVFTMGKIGSFKSGQQKDSVSCGLFAVNAIRHNVLNAPLLDQKETRAERARWFNTLCQTAYEAVRVSCLMHLHDNFAKL